MTNKRHRSRRKRPSSTINATSNAWNVASLVNSTSYWLVASYLPRSAFRSNTFTRPQTLYTLQNASKKSVAGHLLQKHASEVSNIAKVMPVTLKPRIHKEQQNKIPDGKICSAKKTQGAAAQFPPLSPAALDKIKNAMQSDESTIVVTGFSISITKLDMRTLSGTAWLNDQVINLYGKLCMLRATNSPSNYPKIHIFSTFFFKLLTDRGYSSVRRWTKKIDVFALDYVIVPIHLTDHWVCCAFNFKLKQIEYYDSLHGPDICTEALRGYIQAESLDKGKDVDISEWKCVSPLVVECNDRLLFKRISTTVECLRAASWSI
jgi:Ulp1 family protease